MQDCPNDLQIFQRWLLAESTKPFQSLSPEPDGVYENIWTAWLHSLQPPSPETGLHVCHEGNLPTSHLWHQAQAEDVARFLRIRPGQRAHHQPERTLSEVTRRRYWRVLERVYDFAVLHGWLATNPVTQLRRAERPKAVAQLGHTLPPALWLRLPQHFAYSDNLQGARDRAILLLLYELALAPEEVRGLRDEHLLDAQQQPLAANAGAAPLWLRIEGARKAQQRTLAVPTQVGAALVAWHEYRQAHDATLQDWLFHSRKGGPLSIRALFHVASRVIQEAHAALPSDTQHWPLQRVGPQVLRNTAIVMWLQAGVPESEVVRRLGVESGRALVRLQHKLGSMPAVPAPATTTQSARSATKPPAL